MTGTRLLLVDNYDSFTYNLAHALSTAGAKVEVARNDAVRVEDALGYDAIVLSPGPGHPAVPRDVGVCDPLLRSSAGVPMLGVCLGMQAMGHVAGAPVVRAPKAVHGEASPVDLKPDPLWDGLPARIQAGRYHSLVVEEAGLPPDWKPLAHGDGLLMAMRHRTRPWWGVQFHPESILTPDGPRILANFLLQANLII
ncbi:MAG: aminodeoxychorismate/anthranilate synthase component II [Thermoplasmatota archaeon]|nr:aminodeoxychorismate/anthranilate synthase component II [Halobacteriales archaeon]